MRVSGNGSHCHEKMESDETECGLHSEKPQIRVDPAAMGQLDQRTLSVSIGAGSESVLAIPKCPLHLESACRGNVLWDVPENIETTVTLFKDPRNNEYEDKEWHFVIEDVSEKTGKRKQVSRSAAVKIGLSSSPNSAREVARDQQGEQMRGSQLTAVLTELTEKIELLPCRLQLAQLI